MSSGSHCLYLRQTGGEEQTNKGGEGRKTWSSVSKELKSDLWEGWRGVGGGGEWRGVGGGGVVGGTV